MYRATWLGKNTRLVLELGVMAISQAPREGTLRQFCGYHYAPARGVSTGFSLGGSQGSTMLLTNVGC